MPFVEGGGAVRNAGRRSVVFVGGYYGSEVSQILPVVLPPDELSGAPSSRLIDADPFVPADASRTQPRRDGAAPRCEGKCPALGTAAALDGLNLVQKARQQATVLLSHPRLKDQDGNPMPVCPVAELGNRTALAPCGLDVEVGVCAATDRQSRGESGRRHPQHDVSALLIRRFGG